MGSVAARVPMRHRCAPTNGGYYGVSRLRCGHPLVLLVQRVTSSASPKRMGSVAVRDLMRHCCAPTNVGYYEVSRLRRDVNGAAEGISLSLGVSAIQDVGNR